MPQFDKITEYCTKYFLISNATLRSDMAKRIMHSVLPAVADRTTMVLSKGVIDYKALEAAIEGRKDIIKYGVKACVNELSHYIPMQGRSFDKNDTFLVSIDELLGYSVDEVFLLKEDAIDICTHAFSDSQNWKMSFGGFAWEKIAKQLKTIIILDKKLDIIRKEKINPNDKIRHQAMDKETDVMKQILMELNVFDGMAHNTASVMDNLVQIELRDIAKKTGKSHSDQLEKIEKNKIKRLMDTKELENPLHVFREIENTLKGSGDFYRYPDWTNKLRNHPDYINADYIGIQRQIDSIKLKKMLSSYINDLRELKERGLIIKNNKQIQIELRTTYQLFISMVSNINKIETKDEVLTNLINGLSGMKMHVRTLLDENAQQLNEETSDNLNLSRKNDLLRLINLVLNRFIAIEAS